jgi:hypothetical protein
VATKDAQIATLTNTIKKLETEQRVSNENLRLWEAYGTGQAAKVVM